jgi:hypothetical protein
LLDQDRVMRNRHIQARPGMSRLLRLAVVVVVPVVAAAAQPVALASAEYRLAVLTRVRVERLGRAPHRHREIPLLAAAEV